VALQLYSVILLPILHSLWLESGTGNANFFYAATLVYSLGCGMALVDILGAGLRQQAARRMIDEGILDEGDDGITNQVPAGRSEEIKSTKAILEDHDLVVVQYAGLGS
jgi:phosphatidylinositol glycan class U